MAVAVWRRLVGIVALLPGVEALRPGCILRLLILHIAAAPLPGSAPGILHLHVALRLLRLLLLLLLLLEPIAIQADGIVLSARRKCRRCSCRSSTGGPGTSVVQVARLQGRRRCSASLLPEVLTGSGCCGTDWRLWLLLLVLSWLAGKLGRQCQPAAPAGEEAL